MEAKFFVACQENFDCGVIFGGTSIFRCVSISISAFLTDRQACGHLPKYRENGEYIIENKLGLNWAKLSSNWNWALL